MLFRSTHTNMWIRCSYLVGANKAQAQRGQDLYDSGAAVALDRVVGPQLRYAALPENVLLH